MFNPRGLFFVSHNLSSNEMIYLSSFELSLKVDLTFLKL